MTAWLILLALPAMAVASIHIDVIGKYDNSYMKIYQSGSDVGIISDEERNSFQLQDSSLKASVAAYFGKRPDDAYLRSPTPWGDLYQSYGWNQVLRSLKPVKATILKMATQPAVVMKQIFENKSTKPATFNVGISQSVMNSISSSWSKGAELSIGQDITYGFQLEAVNVSGSFGIKYTSSWGKDTEKLQEVTVGSTSEMELMLLPGQKVVAELLATRGTLQVEMEYEASLSGSVAVNYSEGFKGHHFWSLDVNGVLTSGGLETKLKSKEIIEIGFYADSKVVVHDLNGNMKMEASF